MELKKEAHTFVYQQFIVKALLLIFDIRFLINQTQLFCRKEQTKLKKDNSELVSGANQLKLMASDGKRYLTDILDFDGIISLVKQFSSTKANRFIEWFTYRDESRPSVYGG